VVVCPGLGDDARVHVAAWCDWADAWAERTDPTRNVSKIVALDEPGLAEAHVLVGSAQERNLQKVIVRSPTGPRADGVVTAVAAELA
jgi:hypothetical protein